MTASVRLFAAGLVIALCRVTLRAAMPAARDQMVFRRVMA
jgi:hypothetical protein